MDFSKFDKSKINEFEAQAKALWGKTDAYKEFEQKVSGQTEAQKDEKAAGLMEIFRRFGEIKQLSPDNSAAQALCGELKAYITESFYTCTPEILASLGVMYNDGGAMTKSIDAAGGSGTAEFAAKAIEIYCK